MEKSKELRNKILESKVPFSTIAENVGVSTKTIYNWLNDEKELSYRAYNRLYTFYNDNHKKEEVNEEMIERTIKAQEQTIELQKEKISKLEKTIKKHNENPVQTTHWNIIEYDFYVGIKLHFKGLMMGRTVLEVDKMESFCERLGYSLEETRKLWDIDTCYDNYNEHPIEKIITEETKEVIKERKALLPSIFEQLRDMMGHHYIPVPVSYYAKDGTVIPTITYNKVNWVERTVQSKIQYLNI